MNEQLHNHIRAININRICLILSVVIAVACIAGSISLERQCYAAWVSPGEGSVSDRIESVERAIALKPDKLEGYYTLLSIYVEDGVLTKAECNQLQRTLLQFQSKMTSTEGDLSALYRKLAFTYMSTYDTEVQQRLKTTFPYFEQANHYAHAQDLGQMAVETYLQIADYYAEYIWLTGTLRAPDEAEVRDLIRTSRSMLDSFPAEINADRLALACVLADMLKQHGAMWEGIVGTDTINELTNHILRQIEVPVDDPISQKLLGELTAWKNEIQNEEEGAL